ncbi:hypothetical protein NC652_022989 [Populus alba x Populus x berolinensis]|nr:hypothetical protein NC652_022989 [Populus alba x Populus x berolinensis]
MAKKLAPEKRHSFVREEADLRTQTSVNKFLKQNSSQPELKQEESTAAMLRNTWIRWEGII